MAAPSLDEPVESVLQGAFEQALSTVRSAFDRTNRQHQVQSALEQVLASVELAAQLNRCERLESALDASSSTIASLQQNIDDVASRTTSIAAIGAGLRDEIQAELWRIAGHLHEKNKCVHQTDKCRDGGRCSASLAL